MRVLVLDDDPISVEYLAGWLGERGCTVDAAASAAAAGQLLQRNVYEWWLVDRRLPDADGIDWLRARLRTGVRALLLSGDDIGAEQLPAGVLHLRKPVDGARLLRELGLDAGVVATSAAAPPSETPADLDDAAALRALAGNEIAVQALRKMLRAQLEQGREWQQALADPTASRRLIDELHKLRAGAAMTGCLRLAAVCGRLEGGLREGTLPDHFERFEFAAAISTLLQQLPK